MQHLTEQELVLHHYREGEAPAIADQHLRDCDECRRQYETVGRVLALVTDSPVPERSETYGTEVWNRLRWKLGSERRRERRAWVSGLAAAAMLAIAFFAGQFWRDRNVAVRPEIAEGHVAPVSAGEAARADRVLLLVVSDHLDSSERILLELVNADASKGFDVTEQQKRAGELVASNRIYRQAALQQGEARIASVLDDLEPILVELANSGASLDKRELGGLQKRIESKGLLFKVRVVGAQVPPEEKTPPSGTTSL